MNDLNQAQEIAARKNFDEFFRQWWFSVAVMLVITLTNLLPANFTQLLALDSARVAEGELWRLVTCNFVHLNTYHYLLNLVGFLILTAAFREDISPREEVIVLGCGCLAVGIGIYGFSPEIRVYYGLSGALYGLMAHYILVGWRKTPFLSAFFGVFLLSKLAQQLFFVDTDLFAEAQSTADLIGGPVAADSHLYGAVTGLVTGLISLFWFHKDNSDGTAGNP